MYGLLDSTRISTHVSLVLDKLLLGNTRRFLSIFFNYFGALLKQNSLFNHHNLLSSKQIHNCDISARCHGEMENNQM